jgi:hypothetical protein
VKPIKRGAQHPPRSLVPLSSYLSLLSLLSPLPFLFVFFSPLSSLFLSSLPPSLSFLPSLFPLHFYNKALKPKSLCSAPSRLAAHSGHCWELLPPFPLSHTPGATGCSPGAPRSGLPLFHLPHSMGQRLRCSPGVVWKVSRGPPNACVRLPRAQELWPDVRPLFLPTFPQGSPQPPPFILFLTPTFWTYISERLMP